EEEREVRRWPGDPGPGIGQRFRVKVYPLDLLRHDARERLLQHRKQDEERTPYEHRDEYAAEASGGELRQRNGARAMPDEISADEAEERDADAPERVPEDRADERVVAGRHRGRRGQAGVHMHPRHRDDAEDP